MRSTAALTTAACVITTLLAAAAPAIADTVKVGSGAAGTQSLALPNVHVLGVTDGKLKFQSSAGNESSRELAQVTQLALDDEPLLNAAEEALATSHWDAATDGYRKLLAKTTKDWLKLWAARRLVVAGQKANRFDAAASGYVALIQMDPGQAASMRPALPDARSSYLATALAEVTKALSNPSLTPPQRQGLLSFQLDLQRARGDQQAAGATMEQLLQSGALASNDPAAAAQLARTKLQQAAVLLDKGDLAGASNIIRSSSAIFLEPRDQAQALYYLAEAQAAAAAQKNDVPSWQDAAVAYMRVVAHFKDASGAPFVALSLVKAAQIEERLKDAAAARALYQQVIQQYPQDPAAATAKAAAARLEPKSP